MKNENESEGVLLSLAGFHRMEECSLTARGVCPPGGPERGDLREYVTQKGAGG